MNVLWYFDIFWSEDVNSLHDSVDRSKNGADRSKTYWMMQPWSISYQTLLPLPLGADTLSERFSKDDQEIRESVKCHPSPPRDDFNSVETMFDRFKLESWIPKLMCQIKNYFTSSDPHHGISRQILWHIFWHVTSIWHLFWHSICHFFLAFYLLYLRRFFVVEVRLGTLWSWACCSGPAGNTAI